jgi:hypothetical protein
LRRARFDAFSTVTPSPSKKPRTQPSRTGPTSPPPAAWRELAPRLDPDKLVFIDETGCPYRKSNPGILMMETAEDRAADNIPGPLGAARDRRILVQ